jgi:hypothetical protein
MGPDQFDHNVNMLANDITEPLDFNEGIDSTGQESNTI